MLPDEAFAGGSLFDLCNHTRLPRPNAFLERGHKSPRGIAIGCPCVKIRQAMLALSLVDLLAFAREDPLKNVGGSAQESRRCCRKLCSILWPYCVRMDSG